MYWFCTEPHRQDASTRLRPDEINAEAQRLPKYAPAGTVSPACDVAGEVTVDGEAGAIGRVDGDGGWVPGQRPAMPVSRAGLTRAFWPG